MLYKVWLHADAERNLPTKGTIRTTCEKRYQALSENIFHILTFRGLRHHFLLHIQNSVVLTNWGKFQRLLLSGWQWQLCGQWEGAGPGC